MRQLWFTIRYELLWTARCCAHYRLQRLIQEQAAIGTAIIEAEAAKRIADARFASLRRPA